ncbi:hypothetical protein [Thermoplasma sp. Kam2015]|uniref:hypothetical protein n=1 Tax=Thermoplasma sp. Kam2015 TaxID=2094122 RepID=UPI0012933453|nr:hypothetical protein [Thermoplasma sp. Kam2015]
MIVSQFLHPNRQFSDLTTLVAPGIEDYIKSVTNSTIDPYMRMKRNRSRTFWEFDVYSDLDIEDLELLFDAASSESDGKKPT